MERCNLVWFDHDYRVHDHPALLAATKAGAKVLGIAVIHPSELKTHTHGFLAMSATRQQALHHVLNELTVTLLTYNIPLVVMIDTYENAMERVQQHVEILNIFASEPRGYLEDKRIRRLQENVSIPWSFHPGRALLIHEPWLSSIPDVFTSFRKELQQKATYRISVPKPQSTPMLDVTIVDDLNQLDHQLELPFALGEAEAIARLDYYLFERKLVNHYKETRNGMLSFDDSSKLSFHLAMGTLSATQVHETLKHYEKTIHKNDSTYWLRFELWWREFFHWQAHRNLNIYVKPQAHLPNPTMIQAWMTGETGFALVDAAMKELATTGYMSNRARQNVASFFVHYLKQDWRVGADYFASLLIDYDPSSNYLNWQYVAGVGHDPREYRIFNVYKQGLQYDPDALYVKAWLPELEGLSASQIYRYQSPDSQQRGRPKTIVSMPF